MAENGTTAESNRHEQTIGMERAELAQRVGQLQRLASGAADRIRKRVSVRALKAEAGRYASDSVTGASATASAVPSAAGRRGRCGVGFLGSEAIF